MTRYHLPLVALLLLVAAWHAYQVKSALGIDLFKHRGLHIHLAKITSDFAHTRHLR